MKILSTLVFIYFTFLPTGQKECNLLTNGNYRAEYTFNSLEARFQIKIDSNGFTQTWQNGIFKTGKIVWISNCMFKLDYTGKDAADSSDLGKIMEKAFGEKCIDLKGAHGDTIDFRTTFSGNLEITGNEGRFIKIN